MYIVVVTLPLLQSQITYMPSTKQNLEMSGQIFIYLLIIYFDIFVGLPCIGSSMNAYPVDQS